MIYVLWVRALVATQNADATKKAVHRGEALEEFEESDDDSDLDLDELVHVGSQRPALRFIPRGFSYPNGILPVQRKKHMPQSRPSRVNSLHCTRGTLDGRRSHHRRILRGRLTHHRALPAQNKRDECVCVCVCVPVCVFFEFVYVLRPLSRGTLIRQRERRDLWLVCTDDITHTRRTPFCARRPRASK